MAQDKIIFTTDGGEECDFFVVAQTTISGNNYLLVTEQGENEEEADAYIMHELTDDDSQVTYELVEDEKLLSAISQVFEELLDDIDIEM